jgi:hypothetical protein
MLAWCRTESKSVQIQGAKLLQNMVSNTTQHPLPLPATHYLYVLYIDTGKRGEVVAREQGTGATGEIKDQKAGSKIPTGLKVHKN